MWLNKLTHELRHKIPGLGRDCVLSLEERVRLQYEVAFSFMVHDRKMAGMLVSGYVEGNSKSPSIVSSLNGEVAQSGRAHVLGTWGREFESLLPHH